MDSKHHCNGCPHWYVTHKKYPSGFYNITICGKYNKQLYYMAGEENQTPHPCNICAEQFSYIPYIEQILDGVEQVTERKRLTTNEKYPHGAEGVSEDKLTGKYCRGVFEATACVEKLAEYETAEEEGRLKVLPCKVGDTLFCFSRGNIYPFKVRCIRIYEERVEIELWYAGDEENLKFWHITIAEQDIGYKFFFTHKEAEKALKEMEGK